MKCHTLRHCTCAYAVQWWAAVVRSVYLGCCRTAGADLGDIISVGKLSRPLPPIRHCIYAKRMQWRADGGLYHLSSKDDCSFGHTAGRSCGSVKKFYHRMKRQHREFPYQACSHNSKYCSIVRPGLKNCLRHISHHLACTNPLKMLTNTYLLEPNTLSYMCHLIIGKSNYWVCMWYWYYCFSITLWWYRIMI